MPGLSKAWNNLLQGLQITRQQPDLYLKLVLLYSLPPLVAAYLVLFGPRGAPWSETLVSVLPLITMVVAPVVLMHAVDAARGGERIGVLEATRRGVPWVPRYVWTNVHTTVLFWVPVGALVLLWEWSPLGARLPTAVWITVIAMVALHQHVRTVLAPYLAVHGELGGTRAALRSWELGGRHFWQLLGTFVLGSGPVALPLIVAFLMIERFGPNPLSAALLAIVWQLVWVGVQSTRGLLIPALHTAYEDVSRESQLRTG
ncbi:MAG: hypothetical protein JO352_21725 [Chloroflexi bacterium]|nr:hypothetical protein [Chloroflexota bacterium]MBV9600638.1 hypothetical protein [Chloroflexota bacterium]